jgi:hypothetical protein
MLELKKIGKKGISIFGVMGIGFFGFLIIPFVLFYVWNISKVLFQGIMAMMIIAYVKQFGLEGPMMWVIAGILIYILVYKYVTFTATIYMLIIMIGMGFTSAIIWGSSTIRGRIMAKKQKEG